MFIWLLASVFTFGFMYRIIDPRAIFWVGIIFVIYELKEHRINPFNLSFFLLFETYMLTGIMDYSKEPWLNNYWSNVKFIWIFPTVYTLGIVAAVGSDFKESEKRTKAVFLALAFGMFGQAILDYSNKLFMPDWEYYWFAFWGKDSEVRNTFDMGFLLMINFCFYTFMQRKKNKKLFYFGVGSLVAIFAATLLWAQGRLIVVMAMAMFMLFIMVKLCRREIKLSKKIVLTILAAIVIMLAALLILYNIDFMGIQEIYKNSFLSRDGGVVHNVRFKIHIDAAKKTFLYPMGGWEGLYERGGTHNTFFEYARTYNTVVFSFLALFFIIELVNGCRLLAKKENFALNYLLVSSQIIYMIYFFMEPNGFAYRYFLAFPIFICGIVRGWSIKVRESERIRKDELKKYADIPTDIA